jgi:Phage integrase, N-terminal SAM-like domain/Phage integrase family
VTNWAGPRACLANHSRMKWDEALAAYGRELLSRGAAERTRRAYGNDLSQFAEWASQHQMDGPEEVKHRDVRLFAARLSESGAAAATVARKLASVRGLFDHLVRGGKIGQNPADLVASPKRAGKLPKVLAPEQMAELLDRIPAHTPLEVRDRAMFELAYSCGLRCEEITSLDTDSIDFDSEQLRVEGKGGKQHLSASRPSGRCSAIWRPLATRSWSVTRKSGRCCSRGAAAGSPHLTCAAACGSGSATRRSAPASRRTRCATPSPRTCSRAAPTCARSRSSSVMRPYRQPRSTPALIQLGCAVSTSSHTLDPDARHAKTTTALRRSDAPAARRPPTLVGSTHGDWRKRSRASRPLEAL